MTRIVDAVFPPRLSTGFRWLLGSSWVSNLGDGIGLAAGPLLVASQTRDPLLVALAGLLQRLPWVLFGLYAGVIADRHDRGRIVVIVNLARGSVLALLAAAIIGDTINIGLVLAAMFMLGTAEAFADITTGTLMPMLVDSDDLGVANARLTFGYITVNQLAGPPLGAFLFAAGMAWPFVVQSVTMALGALLVGQIVLTRHPPDQPMQRIRNEIADGVRWLWRNPPVRTLTLTVVCFNVTFGAAVSVLVLYAYERLGLNAVGFGLLETVGAIGGIIGTATYGRLERRLGAAHLLRIGLIIETLTHLALALTRMPAVAMVVLLVFGTHEAVWGTTVVTIRQRNVPTELQGRVGSVYMMALMGGLVVGAALGGVIARQWGVTGPFWFAFVGSAVILVTIWGPLDHIARIDQGTTVPA